MSTAAEPKHVGGMPGGGSGGGEGTEARNSCVKGAMDSLPLMSEAAVSSGRQDGMVASDK